MNLKRGSSRRKKRIGARAGMVLGATVLVLITEGIGARAFAQEPADQSSCSAADPASISRHMASLQESSTDGVFLDEIVDTLAKNCGLTKLDSDPQARILSDPSNVTWNNVDMFWDKDVKRYVAVASWEWNGKGFMDEELFVDCGDNKIGGFDGVGIRFGGDVFVYGGAANAWGNPAKNKYGKSYGVTDVPLSLATEYGIGFIKQDLATGLTDGSEHCIPLQYDYNMWGGNVVVSFTGLNECRNIQMFPGYMHTYDDGGITSVGASLTGFSVGWTVQRDKWEKSPGGPKARICPQ